MKSAPNDTLPVSAHRRFLVFSILILVGAALSATSITLVILYHTGFEAEREQLAEMVRSQTRMMEAVARFDAQHSQDDHPGGARAATLSQIEDAYDEGHHFRETGEFVLGTRDGQWIRFLYTKDRDADHLASDVPWQSDLAEPMRRALSEESGTMIAQDYRGTKVLAAYGFAPTLDLGIVAKIDMMEMRGPYLRAAGWALVITLVFAALAGIGSWRNTAYFVHQIDSKTKALSRSQHMLERVVESIPIRVFWKNRDLTYAGCNKLFARDAGLNSPADITGLTDFDVPWREQAEQYRADDTHVLESGNPNLGIIEPQTTPQGKQIWLRTGKVPLEDEQEGIFGVLGIYEDITDEKRIEERLAAESAKLTAMINVMAEGVVFADASNHIIEVNEFFCQLVGVDRSTILGRPLDDFHDFEMVARLSAIIDRFRANPDSPPFVIERKVYGTDAIMRMQPVYRDGRYEGVLLNVVNVTELTESRNEAERARQIAEARNQELVATNVELKAATARAEQLVAEAQSASRAKSEFLANMSHEIRTPMTAILGFAEVLNETSKHCDACLNKEQCEAQRRNREAIETICRNGAHLIELINNILDLSKIEAGRFDTERIACDPSQIVADVTSLARVQAISRGIGFEVLYESAVPASIQTDPVRLKQILFNLIGNAFKFTEAGCVTLITRLSRETPQPQIEFDIVDTGIGMTSEQIRQLFQPFTQADSSTTRRFGGTGLGLAISRRLAELLGGQIRVIESESGRGTRMRLILPTGSLEGVVMVEPVEAVRHESSKAQRKSVCDAQSCRAIPSDQSEGYRILFAEDGPDNQKLIAHLLRKAGNEVTVVENGHLAVQSAREARERGEPYEVLLLDMQMPVMDGYQAARLFKQENYPAPIIALTAHAMVQDREKCLEAGCDAYATKPIDREALINLINRCVEETRGRTTTLAGT